MGLKQSIIIKSEYTNNARSKPGGGSRGASPGQYVMRYMAREDATEVLAPVRYDAESFTRYMVRHEATEELKEHTGEFADDVDTYGSPLVLKHRFRQLDKLSGRAFGSRGLSLSHEDLSASSNEIQDAFDAGHSVQKIVLSFTEDYLRETGVLDPEFVHKGRGSYKGKIDQLKLRTAITKGVEQMTKTGRFAAPAWVGTIQFDTSNVHAHIALTDTVFADSRMKPDGADRGKINESEKRALRKGINHELEDMRQMHAFHGQASLERQNVVAFVKDHAYATIRENVGVQLLIAALPDDKRAWRYKSNREVMKHPNQLATRVVEDLFARDPEGSGYEQAMRSVHAYADESTVKNRLTADERDNLVTNGRNRIIERSVNGLYSVLKTVDDADRQTRTNVTDIRSSSDDELIRALALDADETGIDSPGFALRVRGYTQREKTHTAQAETFKLLADEFDAADAQGLVDVSAHVMRLFYEEEQRYHMKCTDKYRKFLAFNHPRDLRHVDAMRIPYESLVDRFDRVSDADASRYRQDVKDYTFDCFKQGVATYKEWEAVSDPTGAPVLPVRPKTRAENLTEPYFKQVKALDVHHLGLDYYGQEKAEIDAVNALAFADAYTSRRRHAEQASHYMAETGQSLPVLTEAMQDIREMEKAVERAVEDGLITTVTPRALLDQDERQRYTIAPDKTLDVKKRVRATLVEIELLDENEDVLE